MRQPLRVDPFPRPFGAFEGFGIWIARILFIKSPNGRRKPIRAGSGKIFVHGLVLLQMWSIVARVIEEP
jgi:hypothetical protein